MRVTTHVKNTVINSNITRCNYLVRGFNLVPALSYSAEVNTSIFYNPGGIRRRRSSRRHVAFGAVFVRPDIGFHCAEEDIKDVRSILLRNNYNYNITIDECRKLITKMYQGGKTSTSVGRVQ